MPATSSAGDRARRPPPSAARSAALSSRTSWFTSVVTLTFGAVQRPPLPLREREGTHAEHGEGEGSIERLKPLLRNDLPLTFPSLRDGPLPLPQGEREKVMPIRNAQSVATLNVKVTTLGKAWSARFGKQ